MTEYINKKRLLNEMDLAEMDVRILRFVENFPAADVRENVKGKWIESSGATIDIKASADCSQCGALGSPHFKYCWKCGAKMRGGGTCDGDSCTL